MGTLIEEAEADSRLLLRFSASNDQAAFETLVRRHGRLVMGVCRRVLDDTHDADEAFQATFLVLAQKAASLDKPELLANWLYGVAYRAALKMRTRSLRRRKHERQASRRLSVIAHQDVENRELREVLDEEINRLPPKYRAPLVLCYFEGRTNKEVAHLLGWPLGSMSWYLGQARKLLRQRLVRRGVAPSAGMLVAALSAHRAAAAVPPALIQSTVEAAAGEGVAIGSSTARALADELMKALFLKKIAYVATVAAAIPLLVAALAGMKSAWSAEGPPNASAVPRGAVHRASSLPDNGNQPTDECDLDLSRHSAAGCRSLHR